MHVPDPVFSWPYKGLIMVFNPVTSFSGAAAASSDVHYLEVPMYYTGLTDMPYLAQEGVASKKQAYKLSRQFDIILPVQIQSKSFTWYLVTDK